MNLSHKEKIKQLEENISLKYGVPLKTILSSRKFYEAVKARHELWYSLHTLHGMGFPEIARRYGKDHTTVWAAIRKIETVMKPVDNPVDKLCT